MRTAGAIVPSVDPVSWAKERQQRLRAAAQLKRARSRQKMAREEQRRKIIGELKNPNALHGAAANIMSDLGSGLRSTPSGLKAISYDTDVAAFARRRLAEEARREARLGL